ncbi:MAG: GNAT family N-acetyltransferase [Acidobacteria bacterium]|nr:GNAT family N-acetyltransferase [Acidobacteriota bacterium]
MVSFDIIEGTERLMGLREEWADLLRDSDADCLFLTWEWLSTWWRHLSRDRRLMVPVVRDQGRLVALAPMVIRPPGISSVQPFPTIEFMGGGSVGSDYLDVIVRRGREAEALPALADCLAGANRPLELEQVRFPGSRAEDLGAHLGRRGWHVFAEESNVARFIRLAGTTWTSYLAGLGNAHRANFNRRLRRLEREFRVRFDSVSTEEHRRAALSRLIALHQARWRERGFSTAFHTPNHLRFHEEFSRLACERGWLRIFTLWLDDEPVAALYGFRYNGVFSFYQSGFDPNYAGFAAGLVTMGLAIRSVLEEGASEFDMLQGFERYKEHWAREARPLGRLDFYPPHLRGLLYRGTMELSRAARSAARKVLPVSLADRIASRRGSGTRS